MKNRVIYFGIFGSDGSKYKRNANVAASNKMRSILSELKTNFDVELVSCATASTVRNELFFENKNDKYIYCPFNVHIPKVRNRLNTFISKIWSFFYILLNASKNVTVVVYHNLRYMNLIRIAHKIKKFKLVLEVEEIYSKSWEQFKKYYRRELKFIKSANSYIFASDTIATFLCVKDNKYVVIYGSYKDHIFDYNCHNKQLKKIIYVGSIDSTKNGAFQSIECLKYLPSDYTLKIIGYGEQKDVIKLTKLIDSINEASGFCRAEYLGKIEGDELVHELHSCDIGLNPQRVGEYMDFAFPSKVLTFLSSGLSVVSSPIVSVMNSPVSTFITFSETDFACDVAKAILQVKPVDKVLLKQKLQNLDHETSKKLFKLICE